MPSKDLTFILLGEDRSASRVMTQTAEVAEKTTSRIGGAFTKVGGILGGEFGDIIGRTGEGLSQVSEKSGKLSSSLLVGGGVVTGVGVALTNLGSGHKQASDQLQQAVKNSGKSWDDYKDQVEQVISKQEGFGHSAIDTQEALRKLTQSTNDPKKAIADMGLVADLAAAKHISLSDAADMMSKVLIGKGAKALTQFGIVVGHTGNTALLLAAAQAAVTKATTTHEAALLKLNQVEEIQSGKKKLSVQDHIALQNAQLKVTQTTDALTAAQQRVTTAQDTAKNSTNAIQASVDELSKKVSGQATKSVDNFGAQINIAKVRLTDWGASMGQTVGPALTAMGPMLMVVGGVLDIFRGKQLAAAAATTVSKDATIASSVATKLAAAGQWLLNIAMDANPIGLIILAIAALVVGFLFLWNNCKGFRDFFIGMFQVIGAVVGAVVKWIIANWPLLLDILMGPFGFILGFVIKNFGAIVAFFQVFIGNLGAIFGGIGGIIRGAFMGVANFIIDIFNNVNRIINTVIDGVNVALTGVKTLSGGAVNLQVPRLGMIPHLATGGVTYGPTMALIGDNPGGREIVQPLSMYKADLQRERDAGGRGNSNRGGLTIGTFIAQAGQTPAQIAQEMGFRARWATS